MGKMTSVFAFMALAVACSREAMPNNGTQSTQIGQGQPQSVARPAQGQNTASGQNVRGGSDGGGGDTILPWADTAWFVGKDRTVTACFERSSTFGLSDIEVKSSIQSAYKVWADYLKFKTGDVNHSETIDLPTTVQVHDRCSGNEDLVIYFGVKNAQVSGALKQFVHPVAFAKRTSTATFTWDKGFIWIADSAEAHELLRTNWTSDLLLGALVHEIGHVLGCGHVSGTIMRANILEFLKQSTFISSPKVQHAMMSNVDWEDDLLEMGFNFNFNGKVEDFKSCSDCNFFDKFFNELMGRDPVGDVSSRLWRTDDDFHLVIVDGAGSRDFVLDDMHGIGGVKRQKTLFKIYKRDPIFDQFPNLDDEWSDVILNRGNIVTASGKKIEYTFQRGGADDGAWEVQVYPSSGGQWTVFAKIPGGLTAKEYSAYTNRVMTGPN